MEVKEKQRLFVDIDGTLAVFKPVDTLETLYEEGYFLNLEPHENVVAAVKEIVKNNPEIEVNILSAYLTDSQYALQEKNEWLDRYLPEIDQEHRVFVPCGSDKKEGISGGVRSDDFLLDDYTLNLNDWQPPARGIKLLNAINYTKGSWEHDRIRYDRTPTELAAGIISIMHDEKRIFDEKVNSTEREELEDMEQERETGVNSTLKNPYNEKNFKIQPIENGQSFFVRSDSERFGNNEIVFQGTSYDACLKYIDERVDNIEPSYYVIKDLASWRSDVWDNPPERSVIERFDTVEQAIEKFNEYRGMDYLKQDVVEPYTNKPMRRLALGVSYAPTEMAEMDLLHVESNKTLLISDAVATRDSCYEKFMVNSNFIRDLNKITEDIHIDDYSFYRDTTVEELTDARMDFLKENYPDESHSREDALRTVQMHLKKHPDYLKNNKVNERVSFKDLDASWMKKEEPRPVKRKSR